MTWKASPPAVETAAALVGALCLGGAGGFAVARIAPLGAGLVEASVAGVLVALVGWLLIGRVDRQRGSPGEFAAPHTLEGFLTGEFPHLPEQPVDDDVLLLDDPLPAVGEGSRVVQLFATQADGAALSTAFAGPGEMVARIESFLGQSRGGAVADASVRDSNRANAEDASAALHAALADIRRSLRQG